MAQFSIDCRFNGQRCCYIELPDLSANESIVILFAVIDMLSSHTTLIDWADTHTRSSCAYLSQLRRWIKQWHIMCLHSISHYILIHIQTYIAIGWSTFVDLQFYELQSFAHLSLSLIVVFFFLTWHLSLYTHFLCVRLSLILSLSLSSPRPLLSNCLTVCLPVRPLVWHVCCVYRTRYICQPNW